MKRTLLISLAALGLAIPAGTASANDDVTVILGNVPNTVTVLADGLATLTDTYNTTQSFEAVGSIVGNGLSRSVKALVQDAPTLDVGGAVGFFLGDVNRAGGHIGALLDNPSAEGIEQNLISQQDLNVLIARNIPEAPEKFYNGYSLGPFGNIPGYSDDVNAFLREGDLRRLYVNFFNRVVSNGDNFLLADTALGEHYSGVFTDITNKEWVLTFAALPEIRDALDEAQPILAEYMVPMTTQSLLGQDSIADVAEKLEFESTFEFINYDDIVGMAGFEAPPCSGFGC